MPSQERSLMELGAQGKEKERIWNVDVMNIPMDEIIMRIEKDVSSGEISQTIVCANPHSLAVANKDVELLEVFKKSPYVIPDGMGIVLASRLLGGRIKQRVTGPDLLEKLADRWSKSNFGSFFFLGSTPHTLDLLKKSLLERFPGIKIVGMISPPFGKIEEWNNEELVEAVNNAEPTILWVGMTAPKQEKWIFRNKDSLKVPIIGAIGAAFDFSAGTKPRPEWARKLNMDWLPRLLREPTRMWRRTFISLPIFIYCMMKQRIIQGRSQK